MEMEEKMEERTYKVMGGSGALNIAVGVVALVVGVASGVLLLSCWPEEVKFYSERMRRSGMLRK